MSKRRNLKKEKSERNKAYARKFRKTSTRRFSQGGKRSFNRSQSQDNQESAENVDSFD